MSKGASPPAPPDPTQVAQAQTGTNVGTAVAQSNLNNVNRVGPGGSTTFDRTGGYTDPTSGQWVPSYTQTTSLSPLGNQLLQGQQGLANEVLPAIQQGGANVNPLDISGGANSGIVAGGPQAYDPAVAKAVYGEQSGFLDPQWQEQQKQLEDQLSRQGIPVGSDAYNNAFKQFDNSKTQAYQAASNNAVSQGAGIAGQNFGLALQGQQQGVNLQQQQQLNPMMLLAALTSGAGIGGGA
jgi:hypothetical protein